jgi:hypothetical protein
VALRQARPLGPEIYELLGATMSGPDSTVADIFANADKLRDLKVESTSGLHGWKVLP